MRNDQLQHPEGLPLGVLGEGGGSSMRAFIQRIGANTVDEMINTIGDTMIMVGIVLSVAGLVLIVCR